MSKSNSKNTKEQLFQSLVKYDTPYLVSTSPNNKKAFEDISSEDEKTVERLKSIFLTHKHINITLTKQPKLILKIYFFIVNS